MMKHWLCSLCLGWLMGLGLCWMPSVASAGINTAQAAKFQDTHLVEVSKNWSGLLLNNSVAQGSSKANYQRQLSIVEHDLHEMKREYYSGRYSRVRPILLLTLGGAGTAVIGVSFVFLDLISNLAYSGVSGPLMIVGGILLTVSLVCFISGGVWLGRVNRRRKRMLRYMRNAQRRKRWLEQRLGYDTPYYSQRRSDGSQTGLFALPTTSVSNASFSF
ncbi:MAG: hypothetical protein EP343_30470 [Deltaproteobacteria bacterium]|nr:MAG: hypothetical protein EP343_30470 [Deltaproteobacteria bacterium]